MIEDTEEPFMIGKADKPNVLRTLTSVDWKSNRKAWMTYHGGMAESI
jgi:hypothetical protein